jgi:hypothetical protein
MTKLILFLFIAFFIAEIFIAVSIIVNIYKFDKTVNKWNNSILMNKSSLQCLFMDFRSLMEDLAVSIIGFKELIRQKRKYYVTSFLKTAVIYLGIFSLKGKYKKTVLAFQLAKEIYEGIADS